MTTTPDPAVALLAEALHEYGCMETDGFCPSGLDETTARMALNHPALRAALELGCAWKRAEAALPEGWAINMLWGTTTEDRWGAHAGPFPAVAGQYRESETAGGPTPTAALNALADALEARQQSHEVTTR